MDNFSAHRGQKAVDRLRSQWPNVVLNLIEPASGDGGVHYSLEQRLQALERRYEETASPFQWTFYSQRPGNSPGEDR
jgi:hypothetical protein